MNINCQYCNGKTIYHHVYDSHLFCEKCDALLNGDGLATYIFTRVDENRYCIKTGRDTDTPTRDEPIPKILIPDTSLNGWRSSSLSDSLSSDFALELTPQNVKEKLATILLFV